MTIRDGEYPELDELLSNLCDQNLSPADTQRLEDLVLADPAVRAFYVRYLHLHASISRQLTPVDRPRAGVLGFLNNALEQSLGTVIDGRLLGAFGVVFTIGVVLAWAILGSFGVGERQQLSRVRALPDPSRRVDSGSRARLADEHREQLATLVTASDCRWEGDRGSIDSGTRLSSAEIRLASGCAEIAFDDGAKVLLEGPARFTPLSNRSGFLHAGRVVVKVPPHATPFTVLTPLLVAQSNDGEFGVSSIESAGSQVHMFQGTAQVSTQRRGQLDETRQTLVAGAALMVEVGLTAQLQPAQLQPAVLKPTAVDADRFVRRLPIREIRLPAELVSYWNFDELGGPAFDMKGWNHGLLQGVSREPGLIGRGAAKFSGAPGEAVIIGASDDSLIFSTGLTIEAVFVTRWDGAMMSYGEIYRKEDGEKRLLLSLQHDDNLVNDYARPAGYTGPVLAFGLNADDAYHELEVPLDGRNGGPTLAELADGRPHHVAATYDSATGAKRIYLDGLLCAEYHYPPGALIQSGGSQPAMIGNHSAGAEAFHGTLDEVALYRAALDAATIEAHWRSVRVGRGYFDVTEPSEAVFEGASTDRRSPEGSQSSPPRVLAHTLSFFFANT